MEVMSKLTGGFLIAQTLSNCGVKCIFTISSGSLIGLYDACDELGINIIHTRHEAAAAFMADAWSRVTRQLGVCAVTLGPGATNTITGLMSADLAASPMLVIAAQASTNKLDMGYCQSYNVMPLMNSVSKYSRTILSVERIPEYFLSAYRQSMSGRPGPVFLEVPFDIMYGKVEKDKTKVPKKKNIKNNFRSRPDSDLISEASFLLNKSEKPIIIAGSGVWWSGAHKELKKLVENSQIPFFLARMARGAIPESHPLFFGVGYIGNNYVLEYALKNCDAILMIGHRWDYDLNYGLPPLVSSKIKTIQIDIEAEEIGRNRPVEVGIVSDALCAIKDLQGKISRKKDSNWLLDLSKIKKKIKNQQNVFFKSDDIPMHPLRFLKGVKDGIPKDTIVVTGHGEIDFWADPFLTVSSPGHYLRAGQSGTMGAEIPYGVAAKIANPEKNVLVVVGDGAFGYHGFELDTAERYNAPIVIVIGNDNAWGEIRQQQIERGHKLIATELKDRRYEKLAEMLGGYGEYVTDPNDISKVLKKAFKSNKPVVVNVKIRSCQSPYMKWFGKGH